MLLDYVHTVSFPSMFTTAKMKTISAIQIVTAWGFQFLSVDEVYAGFCQNRSRSRVLFEIIQNENSRERHRVQIHRVTFFRLHFFVSSPDLPENEATFAVTAGGIADGKE